MVIHHQRFTPPRRPSSPLPSSVPKAPRAMLNCESSTPTKRGSDGVSLLSRRGLFISTSAMQSLSKPDSFPSFSIPTRPKPSLAEPEHNLAIRPATISALQPIESLRCWACGKGGHDMMECKHMCGHCGLGGHNSIACQYRTLPGGRHGNKVLDGKIDDIAAARERVKMEVDSGFLNSDRALMIAGVKGMRRSREDVSEKEPLSKDPSSRHRYGEPRLGGHEVSRRSSTFGLQKDRRRRRRERSYSPDPYARGEYHYEPDRHPSGHRERGYDPREYRSRSRWEQSESPGSPTSYQPRGYIPEENGKWRRDRSPRDGRLGGTERN